MMKIKALPSQSLLLENFIYNPDTGILSRVKPYLRDVGSKEDSGYLAIKFKGEHYKVHRIVWQIVYGDLTSDMQIDHINGIRDDNRIDNLRKVSSQENRRNSKMNINNKSGYIGVSIFKTRYKTKYRAMIGIKTKDGLKKNLKLGLFDNPEDAHKKRLEASKIHGFHPNHGRT